MPLLRKQCRIYEGDVVVAIYFFRERWDHRLQQATSKTIVSMEICLAKIIGITVEDEGKKKFKIREVGQLHYDPRSYSGFSFYCTENCQYKVEEGSILGGLNGRIPENRFEIERLLNRIIHRYRVSLNELYFQRATGAEDHIECL